MIIAVDVDYLGSEGIVHDTVYVIQEADYSINKRTFSKYYDSELALLEPTIETKLNLVLAKYVYGSYTEALRTVQYMLGNGSIEGDNSVTENGDTVWIVRDSVLEMQERKIADAYGKEVSLVPVDGIDRNIYGYEYISLSKEEAMRELHGNLDMALKSAKFRTEELDKYRANLSQRESVSVKVMWVLDGHEIDMCITGPPDKDGFCDVYAACVYDDHLGCNIYSSYEVGENYKVHLDNMFESESEAIAASMKHIDDEYQKCVGAIERMSALKDKYFGDSE